MSWVVAKVKVPARAAFANREKSKKFGQWWWGGRGGGGVAGVVVAARVEVAVVVVATMALVLVSLLTLYRPSATVLVIHFVLKVIFPEYKKTLKNS